MSPSGTALNAFRYACSIPESDHIFDRRRLGHLLVEDGFRVHQIRCSAELRLGLCGRLAESLADLQPRRPGLSGGNDQLGDLGPSRVPFLGDVLEVILLDRSPVLRRRALSLEPVGKLLRLVHGLLEGPVHAPTIDSAAAPNRRGRSQRKSLHVQGAPSTSSSGSPVHRVARLAAAVAAANASAYGIGYAALMRAARSTRSTPGTSTVRRRRRSRSTSDAASSPTRRQRT